MIRYFCNLLNLRLRGKILCMFLPLVILPIFVIGGMIGVIATQQAHLDISQASKNDLDHMVHFTIDLLDAHYQQLETYKQDQHRVIREELATLTNLAHDLVKTQYQQYANGRIPLQEARACAKKNLELLHFNENGYFSVFNSSGVMLFHDMDKKPAFFDERDEGELSFLRALLKSAAKSPEGQVLVSTQPWNNETLGIPSPRKKIVACRYFRAWDWVIVTSGYLEEVYENKDAEKRFLADFKDRINSKHVGKTGEIFCMDQSGLLTIHPEAEGQNALDTQDADGHYFIREMLRKKSGWLRYPEKAPGTAQPRMKIVRYRYYKPLDWIIAAGFYEDELFHESNAINWRIVVSVCLLSLLVGTIAVVLTIIASRVLTEPIRNMLAVIRQVKKGRFDRCMPVESNDELGELATAFNKMTSMIRHNREMEASLAQQGKMASLGVLSSGVAHEINNPLGVILGYASYLEGKMSADEPYYKFIHEIKRESKRCKKIVQDLLSYARTPKPSLAETDIHDLLHQIVDFAANHTDMHHVTVHKEFAPNLPRILVDGDQLRQVAINLILNAGAAMPEGGQLVVKTTFDDKYVNIIFNDNGVGIPEENLEKIFEPFFTTRVRGTGLGLAITKQIVEQHQGEITLDSTVGKGTTITVRLPVSREDELLDGPETDIAG